MHLIVFDIDGTLTESMSLDDFCFLEAIKETFGFEEINSDWSTYQHTTDPGILNEIFSARKGRPPVPEEVRAFQENFFARLKAQAALSPVQAIPGAPVFLERLNAFPEYCLSLATGAWAFSARLKMKSAGMDFDAFPAASSDDAHSREEILKLSIERAAQVFGRKNFDTIVVFGDAVWDARTCRKLKLPMIGIANGPKAERLLSEGAHSVFPDYLQPERIIQKLKALQE